MKRSEIAMIILIASLSMLFTFTLAQSLLGDKVKRKASVEQATAISQDLVQPAKRTFNKDAVNPTVEVCIEKTQADNEATTVSDTNCTGSDASIEATTDDQAETASSAQPSSASSTTQSGNNTTN